MNNIDNINNKYYDVVIIGGGISGLASLKYLVKNAKGLRILLLESRSSLGGNVRAYYDNNIDTFMDYGSLELFGFYQAYKDFVKDEPHKNIIVDDIRRIFNYNGYKDHFTFSPEYIYYAKYLLDGYISYYKFNKMDKSMCNITADKVMPDEIKTIIYSYTYGHTNRLLADLFKAVTLYGCASLFYNEPEKMVKDSLWKLLNNIGNKLSKNKNNDVTISLNSYVVDISLDDNKKIITFISNDHKNKIFADHIIMAQSYGELHKKALSLSNLYDKNDISRYTKYYAVIVKIPPNIKLPLKGNVILEKISDKPFSINVVAIAKNIMKLPIKNYDIMLLLIRDLYGTHALKEDKNILKNIDIPEYIKNVPLSKILHIDYFDASMPQMTKKAISALNQAQGINNIWFSGQYLGHPSLETAVFTGMNAAHKILNGKNNNDLENIYIEKERIYTKPLRNTILFTKIAFLIISIIFIVIVIKGLHQ